ncbi:LacI family DNA-binding transcriptional regulator [Trueperella sp. LYQ143]|uniref:LacI family DNA-binding transcriptional regulator n=1 Tax=unclassified Trueperella TaxID=2630174 RepID=UPI0039836C6D
MKRTSAPDSNGRSPSAASIAQQLNISRAAVSYALNGKPGVSEETRRRIINLARDYGIDTSNATRRDTTRTPLVGLVLADLANPFYQELGVAFHQAAKNHDFNVILSHTGDTATDLATTVEMMVAHRVDGIILTATQDGDASIAQILRKASIPYVQVSRKMPTVRATFVGIDNRAAAKEMAYHMASHGYQNFAIAIGPRQSSASNERHVGYLEGLIENDIYVPQQRIIRTELGREGGRKAGAYLRSLPQLPEAILCGTDAIARGIIHDFAEHGIRVPHDVALSGFDGITNFGVPDSELTTIVQPIDEMAAQAITYIDDLIHHRRICITDVICPYTLRIGNSCRCPKPQGDNQ